MCTHRYFSSEKATRELAYQPTVSIVEGIDRPVARLRQKEVLRSA
jgi:nucleoside-diphosphate-sugar epimerase